MGNYKNCLLRRVFDLTNQLGSSWIMHKGMLQWFQQHSMNQQDTGSVLTGFDNSTLQGIGSETMILTGSNTLMHTL